MRALVLVLLALSMVACTTHSTIPADANLPDAGPRIDAFVPPDSGRPDAGPPRDAGPRLDDVLIYAHSRDTLYTFSAYTNTVTQIGMFRTTSGEAAPFMLDLAVDSAGVIFTSSDDFLWRVNPANAEVTQIGNFGLGSEQLFALSFLAASESPDGTEMLIGATNEGVYYRVDRGTARTTRLGAYPDGWSSSGDIVSVDGLGTFATLRRSDFSSDVLARILFSSDGRSVVTVIGPTRGSGMDYRSIFGLGYWGRNLYGFTTRGSSSASIARPAPPASSPPRPGPRSSGAPASRCRCRSSSDGLTPQRPARRAVCAQRPLTGHREPVLRVEREVLGRARLAHRDRLLHVAAREHRRQHRASEPTPAVLGHRPEERQQPPRLRRPRVLHLVQQPRHPREPQRADHAHHRGQEAQALAHRQLERERRRPQRRRRDRAIDLGHLHEPLRQRDPLQHQAEVRIDGARLPSREPPHERIVRQRAAQHVEHRARVVLRGLPHAHAPASHIRARRTSAVLAGTSQCVKIAQP